MIEMDLVEAVIGLGANLFYNSPMESCIVVFRPKRDRHRQGKVIFINAVEQIRHERGSSYLLSEHIDRILNAYQTNQDVENFSVVTPIQEILDNDANLSINLYIQAKSQRNVPVEGETFDARFNEWTTNAKALEQLRMSIQESLLDWEGKMQDGS